MSHSCKIEIICPSGSAPFIEYRRHFEIEGKIISQGKLKDEAVLSVEIFDNDGNSVRKVFNRRKNSENAFVRHPMLTLYPEEMDENKNGLISYGFPPIMVKDLSKPYESFRNAEIKCWFNDCRFKAMIVSATDKEHGLVFDDGIGFTDSKGNPYSVLPIGKYKAAVTLNQNGCVIAYSEKSFEIGERKLASIVRFNPASHKENMKKWCSDIGIVLNDDVMPGYLNPYLGKWLYHMGLLPLYLSCDITQYTSSLVYMFIYILAPESTSYSTELAYLQKCNAVENSNRLRCFHYDIGEAELLGKKAVITEFDKNFLDICRIDILNGGAENEFDLLHHGIIRFYGANEVAEVLCGEKVAVMGVVRPWQMDCDDFILQENNAYEIKNHISDIYYEFNDGNTIKSEKRKLMLKRYDNGYIGKSVNEFYNIFTFGKEHRGKTIRLKITAGDKNGKNKKAQRIITICVK